MQVGNIRPSEICEYPKKVGFLVHQHEILNPEACHGLDELVVLNTEPINDSEEDEEEEQAVAMSEPEPEEQRLPEKRSRRIASYGVDFGNYADMLDGK